MSGPFDQDLDDLRESDPEQWCRVVDEQYGRDALIDLNDPYNPDPDIEAYLKSTDVSCTNDELGLDEFGERKDA